MARVLVSLLVIIALSVAWFRLVTAIGLRWAVRYAKPPAGSDTYFLASNWTYRLMVIVPPLLLVGIWLWRRIVSRAA